MPNSGTALVEEPTQTQHGVAPTVQRRVEKLPEPIIRLLVDDNPKRLGSAAYTRYTFYDDGITVNEYFRRGGRPEDIKWDLEHHYIKLEKTRSVRTQ